MYLKLGKHDPRELVSLV